MTLPTTGSDEGNGLMDVGGPRVDEKTGIESRFGGVVGRRRGNPLDVDPRIIKSDIYLGMKLLS